ncbi:vitamin K epoxide reductase family protein [Micrococcoides hystricis]|uniref:Vitamin K epoxide reductase family protein n=1 Tax=Micrococcoides hystricis TaxID=1572761 RepID=A0ABV6P9X9_9MICC
MSTNTETATDSVQETEVESSPWYTRDTVFGWFWAITSVIALIASVTLMAEKMAVLENPNHVTSCDVNPWVSCGTVMKSWQASLFGFPNQFIGVIGYAMMAAIGMAMAAGAKFARWFRIGMWLGATFALVFCLWLFTQAVWVIGALCLYCMVVWAMAIPMWVYLSAKLWSERKTTSPQTRRVVAEWSWVLVVVLYVAITGAILLHFRNLFFG